MLADDGVLVPERCSHEAGGGGRGVLEPAGRAGLRAGGRGWPAAAAAAVLAARAAGAAAPRALGARGASARPLDLSSQAPASAQRRCRRVTVLCHRLLLRETTRYLVVAFPESINY